jgi:hypothetical protein
MTLYILKIEGTTKIPDYLQIRNEEFILISYFKINDPVRALNKCRLLDKMAQIMEIAGKLPYGKIGKLVVD